MVNFLSPGIKVIEQETAVRNIQGVGTSFGALVGMTEKGPLGVAVPTTSFAEWVNTFGRAVPYSKLYFNARGFFANAGEGATLYTVRTCRYTDPSDPSTATALASSVTLSDGANNTLKVEAQSPGAWGNKLQVSVEQASRFSTTLNNGAVLATGATSVVLTSVEGINVGKVLEIDDTTTSVLVVVKEVQNNTIYFDAITIGASIADGASVIEKSFNLYVYEANVLVETWENVSMSDTDEQDYIEARVNKLAASGGSSYIFVTDLDSASAPGADSPANVTKSPLSGGNNGTSGVGAIDFVGNAAGGTGLYALDKVQVINMIAIPDSQTVIAQQGIIDYCHLRGYTLGIMSAAVATSVSGAITYFNETLSANTSYAAAFYPQIKVYDEVNRKEVVVAADAHIMGIYSRVDGSIGIQQVGAGEYGQFADILDFENDETKAQGKRDLLYQAKINPLVNYPGLGKVVFGSRTLSKTGGIGSQINERRVFNFVKQSLELGTPFVLFKLNTPAFRKSVKSTIDSFLELQRQAGVIESFYTDVGEALNNPIVRASGKLVALVAIKVPDTIEFFELIVTRDTRAIEAQLEALA